MNRRWIRLTACLLALLLLAGCGTAAPEKTEPEKDYVREAKDALGLDIIVED